MDLIITLIAVLFLATVGIATLPYLGTARSTDVLIGWKRRTSLYLTGLLAPISVILGASTLMMHPPQGGSYVLNCFNMENGGRSLDPVVTHVISAIAAAPPATSINGQNLEWFRQLLKQDKTWNSGGIDNAQLGDATLQSARETVVLACLFRNNPNRIDVNVGDETQRKLWNNLHDSLIPRFKNVVRVKFDYHAGRMANESQPLSPEGEFTQSKTFALTVKNNGDDHGLGNSVQSLINECTDTNAPSQAWLMMEHLIPAPNTNSLKITIITGSGWIVLCEDKDVAAAKDQMKNFKAVGQPVITIGEDYGDSLLPYDLHTWSGLALTGTSKPQSQGMLDSYTPKVTTSTGTPFILSGQNPNRFLILSRENFCAFTDVTDGSVDKPNALARAALMRSIDCIGANLIEMEASNNPIKPVTSTYIDPYLNQNQLEELFSGAQENLVFVGISLIALGFLCSLIHTALLIIPEATSSRSA